MDKELYGAGEIIVASLFFGFLPVIVRFGGGISPPVLAFFRVAVASLSLFLYFLFFKKKFPVFPKKDRLKLFLFSFLHGIIIIFFFISIILLKISQAVFLLYSGSLWAVLFSYLILKERISRNIVFPLLLSFSGLFLILTPSSAFSSLSFYGIIAGLAAGLGMGLVYVLSKTFHNCDKSSLVFWQNFLATPLLLPFFLSNPVEFSPSSIPVIILMGSVFTALPFILLYSGFEKISMQKGSVLIMLDIPFSVIFAWLIFNEFLNLYELAGSGLMFFGTYLVIKMQNEQPTPV